MHTPSENKRKIIYVITKSNFGGAQRYVYDLATHLHAPGQFFDVAVIFGESGILKQKLDESGIRTISIENLKRDLNIGNDVRTVFSLIRILKRERPGIVHVNSSKMGGLGSLAARVARVPKIIFTVHGLPSREPRFKKLKYLLLFLTWFSCLLSHRTIAVSKSDFDTLKRLPFLSKKVALVPNGVSFATKWEEKNDARRTFVELFSRQKTVLDPLKLWVGTIAELHKNKGLKYLIEAWKKTGQNDAKLLIVGGGEEREELDRLVKEGGLSQKIFFAGFIPDAHRLLPAFDIFVLPSLKEGLPYVVLEAGLARLPVIATEVGGIPDIIEHEKSGILVPPHNSAALASALERLIKDTRLRETYGAALHQTIAGKFSFETMFQKTKELYV